MIFMRCAHGRGVSRSSVFCVSYRIFYGVWRLVSFPELQFNLRHRISTFNSAMRKILIRCTMRNYNIRCINSAAKVEALATSIPPAFPTQHYFRQEEMHPLSLRKVLSAAAHFTFTVSCSSFIYTGQVRGSSTPNKQTKSISDPHYFAPQSFAPTINLGLQMTSSANSDSNEFAESSPKDKSSPGKKIHTHYVFLVHGWLGKPSEMSYLETSINKAADEMYENAESQSHTRLVAHCTKTNDGKTTDGIASGGSRLADEVQQVIMSDIQSNLYGSSNSDKTALNEHHVSMSFVGNSLGGLYARYALSKLPTKLHIDPSEKSEGGSDPNEKTPIIIHPELFVTTATPHLGEASNTFIPIPRVIEQIIGRTLKKTGQDLFRTDKSDLIYEMCTNCELYLKPLTMFRKRIAYVNAFRTDFQVPTSTAGFLNKNSTYPHSVRMNDNEDNPPFIVAVANTEMNYDILEDKNFKDRMHAMSMKLDASGWEKVFVDVRENLPTPGFNKPSFIKKSSRQEWNKFLESKLDSSSDNKNVAQVQSRELKKMMAGSDRVEVPIGHQVMVANSKSKNMSKLTKNGRPVMDHLAQQIAKALLR
jgi:hypothetical protein